MTCSVSSAINAYLDPTLPSNSQSIVQIWQPKNFLNPMSSSINQSTLRTSQSLYHVGCDCFFASQEIFRQANKNTKFSEEGNARFKEQLNHMRERMHKSREKFLRQAIQLSEGLHERILIELVQELEDHFQSWIDFHTSKGEGKSELAAQQKHLQRVEELTFRLQDIKDKIRRRESLFNAEGFIKHFKDLLFPDDHNHSIAMNQVYQVDRDIFGKETLPGSLKRDSNTKSEDIDEKDTRTNNVFDINQACIDDFSPSRPSIFSYDLKMDNSYYSPKSGLMAIGKGVPNGLFKDMSIGPWSWSVLEHENEHKNMTMYVGSKLDPSVQNGIIGLDYVCKGKNISGMLNEGRADIKAMVKSVLRLSKQLKRVVMPYESIADDCYKIGLGIWQKGNPEDGLRNPRTGIGYTSEAIISLVGNPREKNYLFFDDLFKSVRSFIVFNRYVDNINQAYNPKNKQGDTTTVDPHLASEFIEKIFMNQVDDRLGHHVQIGSIDKLWSETLCHTKLRPGIDDFYSTMKGVAKQLKNTREFSVGGIDLEHEVMRSFQQQRYPI